jgi:PAS domain S-box-containing protein
MSLDAASLPSSEARFREVFEQAPISMQLIAASGRTLQVNKAWEDLWQGTYGDGLKQYVLHGDFNILADPQLQAKGVTPYLVRAFAGESVDIPAILYDPNELGIRSEPRWVTAVAQPIKDERGQVAEIILMHQDITDRVRAEETLRISEQRFRSLATAISQVVWTTGPDGKIVEDSPSGRQFTGQSFDEWKEDGWLSALHPDDRGRVAEAWAASVAAKTPYKTEFRVRRADGEYRWTTAHAVPLFNEDGSVREWIGANTDVTEQRWAEQALRASERRMRFVFDAMPQKIYTATPAGSVDYINPAWATYTGLSAESILSWGWTQFIHPDDLDDNLRSWQDSIASGQPLLREQRFRRFDGEYRWHLSRAVPLRDDAGTIVAWIGSNADIHEVKAAEAELALRLEAERRHSSVLAKVAAASQALHASPSIGEGARELVARVRDLLQTHHACICLEADDELAWSIDAVSESGQCSQPAAPSGDALAVPLVGHDGRRIGLLQASGKIDGPFTDEDRAILAQLASIAATGFENARLYASLQEQHRRKDEFLAMLAHELRNPLAPIRAAADLLSLPNVAEGTIRQTGAVIGRQVQHLSSLVDDLLDVSRVTRGQIELSTAVLDIGSVVAEAVEQVRPLVQAKRHELTVSLPAAPAQVAGDHKRLVQIVANILNNAAKYTPRGGRIEVTADTTEREVILRVRDNGIGIAPDLQPTVFNLFVQGERSSDRSQGGLGIGLALVRSLVGLHGGSVSCHSDGPGRGSSFTVTLPRLDQGPNAAGAGQAQAFVPVAARRLQVLVVDDNVDAADMLAMCLEVAGHCVMVEHCGLAALARAAADKPDACILDIGLPDIDGYALARRLRAQPATAGVLLVAVTGYGSDQDKDNAIAAGFDHHLVKPVDSSALAALLAGDAAHRRPGIKSS